MSGARGRAGRRRHSAPLWHAHACSERVLRILPGTTKCRGSSAVRCQTAGTGECVGHLRSVWGYRDGLPDAEPSRWATNIHSSFQGGAPMSRDNFQLPPSVNYHLTAACNYSCHYCFAVFDDVVASCGLRMLPRESMFRLVREVADSGAEKLTFVGGEPTLCPWLPELVSAAKVSGLTTMLVTNGSRLTNGELHRYDGVLDWLTLSVDSMFVETNIRVGRHSKKGEAPLCAHTYREIARQGRVLGMGLKINTVVNAHNVHEDMSELILDMRPERWKIFQALPVEGQNSGQIEHLQVPIDWFERYVRRHQETILDAVAIVPETNEEMRGTYVMIDPAGRFFDNVTGAYRYSKPILEVGLAEAFHEVAFSEERFRERGGVYDWRRDASRGGDES